MYFPVLFFHLLIDLVFYQQKAFILLCFLFRSVLNWLVSQLSCNSIIESLVLSYATV